MGGPLQAQGLVATPPLDRTERLHYYLERTYGVQRLSWLAVETAVDHLLWEPEWGRGARGYGCQFASGFGRRLISNSIEFGAGLALHEDVGFQASHRSGLIPRMRYAVAQAFIIRAAGGRTEPAYARFAGITGAALIVPAWHHTTLSGSGFAWDIASSTMDQLQNSFLTEFTPDLKRVGQKVLRKLSRNP